MRCTARDSILRVWRVMCMELKKLPYDLTVCKVASLADVDLNTEFFFLGKTDEE